MFELFKEVFGELRKVSSKKPLNLSEFNFRCTTGSSLKSILLTKSFQSRAEDCPLYARMNKTYNSPKAFIHQKLKKMSNNAFNQIFDKFEKTYLRNNLPFHNLFF